MFVSPDIVCVPQVVAEQRERNLVHQPAMTKSEDTTSRALLHSLCTFFIWLIVEAFGKASLRDSGRSNATVDIIRQHSLSLIRPESKAKCSEASEYRDLQSPEASETARRHLSRPTFRIATTSSSGTTSDKCDNTESCISLSIQCMHYARSRGAARHAAGLVRCRL